MPDLDQVVADICALQGEGVKPADLCAEPGDPITVTIYLNGTRKMISYAGTAKVQLPAQPAA